jgi:two-component system response regulator
MADPILYVEDGPDDVFFMQRAFGKVAPNVELKVITNGQEAADFFDASKDRDTPFRPLSLVILDLNLPGRSGMEVLAQIRKKSRYRTVPVILFSASNQQTDIDACYLEGCNAYLIKPNDPEGLRYLVSLINDFWLKENRYSKLPGTVAIVSA